MVDMEGIDLLAVQGEAIPGLYDKLVESIAQCRYQCVYNWAFNSILIPPTYVEMEEREDGVWINEGVMVDEEDVVHIASIEPEPPAPILPVIESLSVAENGTYLVPEGVDGFNPVSVQVPTETVRNYTNYLIPESSSQITDISNFTKIFSTTLAFGSLGTKVDARLSVTDESAIASLQSSGWNASGMAFYDSENIKGAYGGYVFGESIFISKVKLWLGRYSSQNKTLVVTVEYMDSNNQWVPIKNLNISQSLPYPSNVFTVELNRPVYGVRWIHSEDPLKSSSNNITFAGMSIYEASGDMIPCYVPVSGLNDIPEGYSGFGPIYVN